MSTYPLALVVSELGMIVAADEDRNRIVVASGNYLNLYIDNHDGTLTSTDVCVGWTNEDLYTIPAAKVMEAGRNWLAELAIADYVEGRGMAFNWQIVALIREADDPEAVRKYIEENYLSKERVIGAFAGAVVELWDLPGLDAEEAENLLDEKPEELTMAEFCDYILSLKEISEPLRAAIGKRAAAEMAGKA
jgi:hypothetical protein